MKDQDHLSSFKEYSIRMLMTLSEHKINSIAISGTVYASVLTANSKLILDVRNQEKQAISYASLDLNTFKLKKLPLSNNEWWTKLVAADINYAYLTKYLDRNDPNSQIYLRASFDGKEIEEIEGVPTLMADVNYPALYEIGTDHHKTVANFLGLDLPLSCEYLECEKKIIISYYLRSDNAFDRFLLLLDNGKKEWKLQQDSQMKGFSPGGFFIHQDQLIFFKELNEVCIYNL